MNDLHKINSIKNKPKTVVWVDVALLLLLCCLVDGSSASSDHSDLRGHGAAQHANRLRPAAVKPIRFNEGDVCRGGQGSKPIYVCVEKTKCRPSAEDVEGLGVCSSDESRPIVCCPTSAVVGERPKRAVEDRRVVKKCREYSQMSFYKDEESDEQTSGERYLSGVLKTMGGPRIAHHQEFPHLAMIGYGVTAEEMDWRCAGSLISERWILTAAHCYRMGALARWARLGDVDRSPVDAGRHRDYKIDVRWIHPNYIPSERYYDIALFRLNEYVKFSASVRPICINPDPRLEKTDYPVVNVWGKTFVDGRRSNILIKVPLRNIPIDKCSRMFNSLKVKDRKLKRGIDGGTMICAGTFNVSQLICTGDSGGALQIPHKTYKGAAMQIGVTSFGSFCGVKNTPGVYTKVANHLDWIESTVWPTVQEANPVLPRLPRRRNAVTRLSDKKCKEYSPLGFPKADNVHTPIVGGHPAHEREFTHMALIGYGDTTEDVNDWRCGGSLISERWVLSAAHCHSEYSQARWARLGELDIMTTLDEALPKDYEIVEHVLHPNYKRTERYNDIALFRLGTDVEFSKFVKPICLNTDPTLMPKSQLATGWGRTSSEGPQSTLLLETGLTVFDHEECRKIYSEMYDPKLKRGIEFDSMVCAGSNDGRDTCVGDSGGPLQWKYADNSDSFVQFGVTSFGPTFCANNVTPGVFTKVSKYVQWIEDTVWPGE